MKILMVTPFPPQPDGIGAYAVQATRQLRRDGDTVEVLSPGPSAAHHHLDLRGPRGALALAKRARHFDEVVIQFHPDFFYRQPLTSSSIAAESLALLALAKAAPSIEMRIHEIDYRWGQRPDAAGRATRLLWRAIDRIVVHTEVERDDMVHAFGVDPARVEVVPHGVDFRPHTTLSRNEARTTLGLPPNTFCFLSIGFIQPHKGFDRAVRAFAGLDAAGARLDVVGGIRLERPDFATYADELERLIAETPGAHFHPGFVSDELFDRWIVAADALVLPYRNIWSSGVLERARLYDRPIIATDVGGLRQQAGDRSQVTIVDDDEGLAMAMRRVLGLESSGVSSQWRLSGQLSRGAVQAAIEERAAALRGGPASPPRSAHPADRARTARTAAQSARELRRLGGLALADPEAGRPGTRALRRAVQRLTAWQLRPVIDHVNRLRNATLDALDED